MCGQITTEERHPPTIGPAVCEHKHTDHRGSNKHVRRTDCNYCGEYIDVIDRDLHLQIEQMKKQFAESDINDTQPLSRVATHDGLQSEQAHDPEGSTTHVGVRGKCLRKASAAPKT
ncbi:hypothetical protein N9L68_05370 [bacterium]|nr:hypothetical protein [bacterium]